METRAVLLVLPLLLGCTARNPEGPTTSNQSVPPSETEENPSPPDETTADAAVPSEPQATPPDTPDQGTVPPSAALGYGHLGDGWCTPCDSGPLPTVKVTASSSLVQGDLTHTASRVQDDSHQTAWCEGVAGEGIGEWLEFTFSRPVGIGGILLSGGYFFDADRLESNGRVKTLTIGIEGATPFQVTYEDPAIEHRDRMQGDSEEWFRWATLNPPVVWNNTPGFPPDEVLTQKVRLTIEEVYSGTRHQDTCISDVTLNLWDPGWDNE